MKIKATSKAKGSKFSPWNTNDPCYWMWQKTVLKQLAKTLPTSEKIDRAMYLDNISERGGFIKDEKTIIEEDFTKSTVEEAPPAQLADKFNQKKEEAKKEKKDVEFYAKRIEKCSNVENIDLTIHEAQKDLNEKEIEILRKIAEEKAKQFTGKN